MTRAPTLSDGSNGVAGSLPATNSSAPISAVPAHLADERVVGERLARGGACISAPRARRLRDEALALDQVEVRHRDGGRERMRRVRVAVAERAARRALDEHPPDAVGDDAARERDVAGGEALGDRDQVGLDPEDVAAEPLPEPAEAR